jgi:hypothetical protein
LAAVALILALPTVFVAIAGEPDAAEYGTKVRFGKDRSVTFPHFTLTYVGDRRVKSRVYPRGFLFHDFRVTNGGTQTISWSSGTGEIAPTEFKVGRRRFSLELSRSEKNGRPDPDELVINQLEQ